MLSEPEESFGSATVFERTTASLKLRRWWRLLQETLPYEIFSIWLGFGALPEKPSRKLVETPLGYWLGR